MEVLEIFLHSLINLAILLFEYIGVLIIAFAGIQGVVNYVRGNPETRLILAKGLAMGLEFKLGGEILRTVIVNSLAEIAIVAGIIVLRATLTVLIHWEIKNEQQEKQELLQKQKAENERRPEVTAADSEAAVKKDTTANSEAAVKKGAAAPDSEAAAKEDAAAPDSEAAAKEDAAALDSEAAAKEDAAASDETARNSDSTKTDLS